MMARTRMTPKPAKRRQRHPAEQGKVSPGFGAHLRRAREQKGLTVRGLARYVGVSPSLISQVERDRVTPSVGTLYALANELNLVVDDLFRDLGRKSSEDDRAAVERRGQDPVQRKHTRKVIKLAGGVRWERLTPTPDKDVEFLYVVYEVGASSCAEDSLIRHGGIEYAYIISGRLGIRIGFEAFQLDPGDSISWDAQMPHRLWTIGDKPAVAIWVVLNRHGDSRVAPTAS
jgi:transcriptional regulator with XRE-family HTH domain